MTKRDIYEFVANFIDIIITVFMITLVYDVLTGTTFDLIINGTAIIAIIGLENILKFLIKMNDDIED